GEGSRNLGDDSPRQAELPGVPVDDAADIEREQCVVREYRAELGENAFRVDGCRRYARPLASDSLPAAHRFLDGIPPLARPRMLLPEFCDAGEQRAERHRGIPDETHLDRVPVADDLPVDVDLNRPRLSWSRVELRPRVV